MERTTSGNWKARAWKDVGKRAHCKGCPFALLTRTPTEGRERRKKKRKWEVVGQNRMAPKDAGKMAQDKGFPFALFPAPPERQQRGGKWK